MSERERKTRVTGSKSHPRPYSALHDNLHAPLTARAFLFIYSYQTSRFIIWQQNIRSAVYIRKCLHTYFNLFVYLHKHARERVPREQCSLQSASKRDKSLYYTKEFNTRGFTLAYYIYDGAFFWSGHLKQPAFFHLINV